MSLEGTRVVPDTRKGLVRIGRGEEGLIHFQWLDRGQNFAEDVSSCTPALLDISYSFLVCKCVSQKITVLLSILDSVFHRIKLSSLMRLSLKRLLTASSGRVYILKFKHDDRKFFLWMQEPNADGDSQICRQVNAYINRPMDADAVSIEAEMSHEDTADDDISSRAGNLVDQSMTSDLAGEVTSAAGPVRLADLQRILSAIQPSDVTADPDAGLGLGDILKPDLVLPLIESLPIEQLASHLPEGSWTAGDILELLQSPPLRQQLDAFTHVLRTGQIDLAQFGVDRSKYKFTVASFLEALEDSVAKAHAGGDKDSEPKRGGGIDPMDES
ncbi:hypothetical protein ACQ4PT_043676 [Festuca glaucescens]